MKYILTFFILCTAFRPISAQENKNELVGVWNLPSGGYVVLENKDESILPNLFYFIDEGSCSVKIAGYWNYMPHDDESFIRGELFFSLFNSYELTYRDYNLPEYFIHRGGAFEVREFVKGQYLEIWTTGDTWTVDQGDDCNAIAQAQKIELHKFGFDPQGIWNNGDLNLVGTWKARQARGTMGEVIIFEEPNLLRISFDRGCEFPERGTWDLKGKTVTVSYESNEVFSSEFILIPDRPEMVFNPGWGMDGQWRFRNRETPKDLCGPTSVELPPHRTP